jgi:hypothetical protein
LSTVDPMAFERHAPDGPLDETDVNLRAYIAALPEGHLGEYRSHWSDEHVIEWHGNFRSDGALMLVCCERDVGVSEFRRVLEMYLALRGAPAS